MITNVGKTLITKFLLGQAPAYASYLAIGCGSKPLTAISYAVSNKNTSSTAGTAILTTATHDIAVGDYITVSGLGYGLDGVYVATTGTTGTTVKYATTTSWSGNEAVPTGTGTVTKNYSTKTELDFEMYRSPITSRGYITENGISKVVLTSELPSEERYEITEIGIFSAQSNPSSTTNGSRTLFAFTTTEKWGYYDGTSLVTIPQISTKLDLNVSGTIAPQIIVSDATVGTVSGSGPYTATITGLSSTSDMAIGDVITATAGTGSLGVGTVTITAIASTTSIAISSTATFTAGSVTSLNVVKTVFQANADNSAMNLDNRINRQERSRFYNNMLFTPGNIDGSTAVGTSISSATKYIQLLNTAIDLSSNTTTDEIRVAFSVVNKVDASSPTLPGRATVGIQFISTNGTATGSVSATAAELSTNRYQAKKLQLKDFTLSTNFSWSDIISVKVFSGVNDSGNANTSALHYLCIDAIRLENTSTLNPLYGLSGYSPVVNSVSGNARPIVKDPNVASFVEFRYAMDVT